MKILILYDRFSQNKIKLIFTRRSTMITTRTWLRRTWTKSWPICGPASAPCQGPGAADSRRSPWLGRPPCGNLRPRPGSAFSLAFEAFLKDDQWTKLALCWKKQRKSRKMEGNFAQKINCYFKQINCIFITK
jgi:hypothetical protein